MRNTTMKDIAEVISLKQELRSVKRWYLVTVLISVLLIIGGGLIMRTMKEHPVRDSCIKRYPNLSVIPRVVPPEQSKK